MDRQDRKPLQRVARAVLADIISTLLVALLANHGLDPVTSEISARTLVHVVPAAWRALRGRGENTRLRALAWFAMMMVVVAMVLSSRSAARAGSAQGV